MDKLRRPDAKRAKLLRQLGKKYAKLRNFSKGVKSTVRPFTAWRSTLSVVSRVSQWVQLPHSMHTRLQIREPETAGSCLSDDAVEEKAAFQNAIQEATLAVLTFLSFDGNKLGGAAINIGSPTSHISILARARGVPMLVGVPENNAMSDMCVLYGVGEELIVEPSLEALDRVYDLYNELDELNMAAHGVVPQPTKTADATSVRASAVTGYARAFKTQPRALVRANVDVNLKIMVQMVTVTDEMLQVRAILDEVCAELKGARCPELGMMIEVPAAGLTAASFKTDFFSTGSNDLVQYTMATSRDNPAVSGLAKVSNPAMLELIKRTIDAASEKQIDVSLCGDTASNEVYTAVLFPGWQTRIAAFLCPRNTCRS